MWTDFRAFQGLLYFMVMAAVLRFSWELGREHSSAAGSEPLVVGSNPKEERFPSLSPQRQNWAKKSVEGYIRQQEKKWQRWDEALFKAK